MSSTSRKVFFDDYVFEVCDNVYEPSEDSFFFAENLHLSLGLQVLDVGTGSGFLGIIASKNAKEVSLIDINPYAVRCAKLNAKLNKIKSPIRFIQSNLFSAFRDSTKFEAILFNAPYVPTEETEEQSWIDYAWAGGVTGRRIIDKFIYDAPKFLSPSGEILLLQSSLSNVEETQKKFLSLGLETKVVASLKLAFFETLVLIRASFLETSKLES